MPGSIPASATSEVAPGFHPLALAERAGRGRAWRRAAATLGIGITATLIAVAVFADRIAPGDPLSATGPPLSAPSRAHPMGTDDLGRDLWACIAHGARTSLLVVFGVTALSGSLGMVVGCVSGWQGGALDDLLMRVTEAVQVIPRFFLAVAAIALFGPGVDRLVVLLGLTSWPLIARVARAAVLSLRERAFVEAARALGAPPSRILVREVLPGVLPTAVVVASMNAASVLLLEAGLSFLGLGDPDRVSWGYLANNAQRFLRVAWWMAVFPGASLAIAVVGLDLLGDAASDALNRRTES